MVFFNTEHPRNSAHDSGFVVIIHYSDVILGAMVSQITSLSIGCSIVCSKKTSKLRVTGLYEGNSPVTGEFPSKKASNAKFVSIWWRHHVVFQYQKILCIYSTFALLTPRWPYDCPVASDAVPKDIWIQHVDEFLTDHMGTLTSEASISGGDK